MFDLDIDSIPAHAAGMEELAGTGRTLRPGFRHHTFFGFLSSRAAHFEHAPKPDDVEWGVPRMCFWNAHEVVSRDRRWLYAEGLALSPRVPFPFHHGWIVDRVTGLAHDVTVRDAVALWGVAFTRAASLAALRASKKDDCCSVLDCPPRGWPLLLATDEELAQILVTDWSGHERKG